MAVTDARTPRGSFQVNQRLLRGYGPLAVLAAMLILMAMLVPSKPSDSQARQRVERRRQRLTASLDRTGGDDTTGDTESRAGASGGGTSGNGRSPSPRVVAAR